MGHKQQADEMIRLQDLWGMFLAKWPWFVISLVVSLALATLYVMRSTDIYTRSASILIKDDSKGGSSMAGSEFSDLGFLKNNTNINNELQTISSPALVTEVVKRLALNETYSIRKRLKRVELYKSTPVMVVMNGKGANVSFSILLKENKQFVLTDFVLNGDELAGKVNGTLNKAVKTPVGQVTLVPTKHYTGPFVEGAIVYSHGSIEGTADFYAKNLRTELGHKEATIINLSISDASIQRAEDFLNTLVEVYNEKWIQDKNQIAVSTSRFINDRLAVIEKELGHVDENISSFKSKNLVPDVNAASGLYFSQSADYQKKLVDLNMQLITVQYIRKELNAKKMEQPLPSYSN